jgi:hypothetical protein
MGFDPKRQIARQAENMRRCVREIMVLAVPEFEALYRQRRRVMERTPVREQTAEIELTPFGENRQDLARSWLYLIGSKNKRFGELLAPPTWAVRDE